MKIITADKLQYSFPVSIVVSRFNEEITQRLFEGTLERLQEQGIPGDLITAVWVPGTVEIPLIAQRLAQSAAFSAIIALGAVIRGETGHYDYVCKQVSDGCQKIMLTYNIPVIFGVLTTENWEQALDRTGGNKGHKGREAADAALEMVSLLTQLSGESF